MNPQDLERIEAAHLEALSLPADGRENFLRSRFASDPELLNETRELVKCSEQIEGFLETPLIHRFAEADSGDLSPLRVGPYRLVRELGSGGAASVYLARRDDDLFEKQVAIKILNRLSHSREAFLRFQREIQTLARLEHPYIVRMLDAGLTGEAVAYIVTELVEGEPVDRFAANQTLPARLRLFCRICEGVSAAHRGLVVHRDLKPSNILVTADGSPKLLDFGIAILLDGQARLTETGVERMTVYYASPEQLRGEKTITTASDVYSLGLLLHELIGGAEGASASGGYSAPGASKEPLALRDAPRELRAIVRKATEYEAGGRYESADRLREDIVRFLDGSPVLAHDDSAAYRIKKFARKHWMPSLVAMLAASMLLAMSVVSFRSSREAERQSARVKHLLSNVLGTMALDRSGYVSIRSLRIVQETELTYFDSLVREYPQDRQFARLRFDAWRKLGTVEGLPSTLNLGETAAAREALRKAVEAGEEILIRDQDPAMAYDLPIAYLELGSVLLEMGRDAEAQRQFERSERLSGAAPGAAGKRSGIEAAAQKSRILALEGRNDEALRLRREVMEARRALFEKNPAEYRWEYAGSLCSLGELLRETGRFEEAGALYAEALPMIEQLVRVERAPRDSMWHLARENEEYAKTLLALGETSQAERRLRDAIALYRRIRNDEPDAASNQRSLAISLSLLGDRLAAGGDRRNGLAMLEEAVALSEECARRDAGSARAKLELAEIRTRLERAPGQPIAGLAKLP